MPVVSVSLNENLLEDVEEFMEAEGFSGRSEVIRTALRSLLRERKKLEELEGVINAVIVVTHVGDDSEDIDNIQHSYRDVIETHLHNHTKDHSCLEVFTLEGNAEQIKDFYSDLNSSSKVKQAELNVA